MAQTLDNLSYTWNNAGTVFTGLKLNITDTASAAGSLLMDLQVGGSSKCVVTKAGVLHLGSHPNAATFGKGTWNQDAFIGSDFYLENGLGTYIKGTNFYGWATGSVAGAVATTDLRLYRDAANTLAQRNGVNAQTSRLYGTYTDASNYRRLTQTMSVAGVAEIKPEGAGTGASGNVLHISGLPTSNPGAGILWNDNGTVKVGT